MNTKVVDFVPQVERQNWVEIARRLAPEFGMRAADYDDSGDFVAENYRDLSEHELFSAGIPEELGGGGASYEALCDIVREIGQHCVSTERGCN